METACAAEQNIIIQAAAVADHRPAVMAEDQKKQSDDALSIPVERT